jgi:hypothetical protein
LALGKGGEVRNKGRAERGWVGGDGGEDGGVALEDGARVADCQVQGRVAGLRRQNTRACTDGPRKNMTGTPVMCSGTRHFLLCKDTHLRPSLLTLSLATALPPAATMYSAISPCPPNAAK